MNAYPGKAKFTSNPKRLLNFNEIFKDVKILGAGGFGETHLIVDKLSSKKYALKLLHPKDFNIKDYYREVSALINLSSQPNCNPDIVCYYDHFILQGFIDSHNRYNTNKYHAILMEYIDGMTLRNFDESYRLSINDVIYLGLWLLKLVKYLHAKGYAHNDISKDNIMITKNKQLKLIDLGLSCYDKSNSYLRCGTDRGVNLYYMSPELHNGYYVNNTRKYAKTSDIYAIGILMYELFTGKRPYDQNKNLDIISPYHHVKNSCIDKFLNNVLLINPDQRATADQAYRLLKNCY